MGIILKLVARLESPMIQRALPRWRRMKNMLIVALLENYETNDDQPPPVNRIDPKSFNVEVAAPIFIATPTMQCNAMKMQC